MCHWGESVPLELCPVAVGAVCAGSQVQKPSRVLVGVGVVVLLADDGVGLVVVDLDTGP